MGIKEKVEKIREFLGRIEESRNEKEIVGYAEEIISIAISIENEAKVLGV